VKNISNMNLFLYTWYILIPVRKVSRMIITLIRLFLGVIFLITGISKIPIFNAFAYSITELTPLAGWIIYPVAACAIAIEIIIGLGLILKKQVRVLSGTLTLLIFSFIIMLSAALFRFEHYVCTCFGILGLELPVHEQIVIDLILINLSLLIFFRSTSETPIVSGVSFARITGIVVSASIIWSAIVLTQPAFIFGEKPELNLNEEVLFSHAASTGDAYSPRLVIMVDFGDFYCPTCLDDFLDIAETVSNNDEKMQGIVSVLVKRIPFMDEQEQREFVDTWQYNFDVTLPMPIDTAEIFERSLIEKSTVLLFDRNGNLLDSETLPMGPHRRSEIMERFFGLL
jgi:uncharacterized membrane protein YphA (DoxX/SURF4 family)